MRSDDCHSTEVRASILRLHNGRVGQQDNTHQVWLNYSQIISNCNLSVQYCETGNIKIICTVGSHTLYDLRHT